MGGTMKEYHRNVLAMFLYPYGEFLHKQNPFDVSEILTSRDRGGFTSHRRDLQPGGNSIRSETFGLLCL